MRARIPAGTPDGKTNANNETRLMTRNPAARTSKYSVHMNKPIRITLTKTGSNQAGAPSPLSIPSCQCNAIRVSAQAAKA